MYQQQQFYTQQPQQPTFGGYPGYMYTPRPAPRYTQPVTAELAKLLMQSNDELDIRISNAEKIRNWCTHKEPGTGRVALVPNADGTVTCRTCGTTFRLISDEVIKDLAANGKIQTVEDVQNLAIDIVQTIKVMYTDIPEEFLKNFSQVITIMGKIYDLFKRGSKSFNMIEAFTGNIMPTGVGMNAFQVANGMMNMTVGMPFGAPMGGFYGNPGYPMNGMPQATMPMGGMQMPQQPMAQPGMPVNGVPGYSYGWGMPQQPMAGVPTVDARGNVYPPQQQMPNGPTTMNGQPIVSGYNPFMDGGNLTQSGPGMMSAPVNQQPAPQAQVPQPAPAPAPAVDGIAMSEPTQTKQMIV